MAEQSIFNITAPARWVFAPPTGSRAPCIEQGDAS